VGTIELSDLPVAIGQAGLTGSRKCLDPSHWCLGDCNTRGPSHEDGSEHESAGS